MNYAYARVSCKDQKLERQLIAFNDCNIAFTRIFCDKKTGENFERQNYKKLIKKLRYGDLLVIKSIDRLGRNYDCIIREWRRITKEIGADIYVIDMPLLDTRRGKDLVGTFLSDIVLQVLSFVAENERDNIRQRQAEGIAAAKARGVRFGRPAVEPPENFESIVAQWQKGRLRFEDALAQCGMSSATFYRRLRERRLADQRER